MIFNFVKDGATHITKLYFTHHKVQKARNFGHDLFKENFELSYASPYSYNVKRNCQWLILNYRLTKHLHIL